MRRYVIPARTEKVVKSTKSRKKSSNPRKSNVMTEADLMTLPAHMRDTCTIIQPKKPIQPKPVKPEALEMRPEDVFINSRATGSKTLNYRRSNKQPLYTFDDRLSRVHVMNREYDSFTFRDNMFKVTDWLCSSDMSLEALKMIDDPEKLAEVSFHHVVQIILVNEPECKDYLLETPAGRVCPNCKTNEFIKSDLKNMPISFQDKHWRDRDSYGEHCEQCRCTSESFIQSKVEA